MSEQKSLGKAESIWVDTTTTTNYASLSSVLKVDVAVIGAGIAGLTTAYLLQSRGLRVAVIDMGEIVKGATGYTTAKVTSLHTLIYDHLLRIFGNEQAQMYGNANQAGLEKIAELVEKLHIDCDFKRTNAYTFTEDENDVKSIQAEAEAALKLGLPAHFVEKVPLPLPIKAAVTFDNQAQFHPRKYLLALANEFIRVGGNIFEHTRVLEVKDEKVLSVITEHGMLTAEQIVLASQFPIYDPALYFTRLAIHRSCVIAVNLNGPMPQGMFIGSSETSHSMRNQATDSGELLLIGGEGYKTGQGGDIKQKYERLNSYARQHFPVSSTVYHWSTQDVQTPDRVPYIGRIKPGSTNIYVATGFNGWGMTNGTAAGMLISDMILKQDNPWAKVFEPSRFKPLASAVPLVSEGLNVLKEILSGFLSKSDLDEVNNLVAGEGIVVQQHGEKIAVSKDALGKLQTVSAVCPHMGCIVAWNNAEMSWDCPCHGSRFAVDGRVLQGPAVKNLEAKELDSLPAADEPVDPPK